MEHLSRDFPLAVVAVVVTMLFGVVLTVIDVIALTKHRRAVYLANLTRDLHDSFQHWYLRA